MNGFNKLSKIRTYLRLGVSNLVTVALYRFAVKTGYFVKKQPIKTLCSAEHTDNFFNVVSVTLKDNLVIPELKSFGWLPLSTDTPPHWLQAVNSDKAIENNSAHWSLFDDFSLNIGDIKTVWESSRFDWLINFSLRYIQSGDASHIEKINTWLTDWCAHNPVNQGVNWKCGQEASIRVMHIATAIHLLKQTQAPCTKLSELLFEHIQRIAPTLRYAMAQDNNHGTSEAAALYIGSLLLSQSNEYKQNSLIIEWRKQGQYWLENRAKKLIDTDGTFSQNSVNYHRLMLDTLSLVEFFKQHVQYQLPSFSASYYKRVKSACIWLRLMTNSSTGRTPILGPNDGAKLLPLSPCDYLDYRPSIQWAYGLFFGYYPYAIDCGYHQLSELLKPLKLDPLLVDTSPKTSDLSQGFHLLEQQQTKVYLRAPNTKFRPSSCEALHIDLWVGNNNLLHDTGSYSYNCDLALQNYFVSTQAHNTVQFDAKEQMPKISRFLYHDWISCQISKKTSTGIQAHYRNDAGHYHHRSISLSSNILSVSDVVSGFKQQAVLRWHLPADNWELDSHTVTSKDVTLKISANVPITSMKLVESFQSRYYLQKELTPVLEITIQQAGSLQSLISWS